MTLEDDIKYTYTVGYWVPYLEYCTGCSICTTFAVLGHSFMHWNNGLEHEGHEDKKDDEREYTGYPIIYYIVGFLLIPIRLIQEAVMKVAKTRF